MKVIVTESQLRNILKKQRKKKEFDEATSLTSPSTSNQSTSPASSTTSSTTSTSTTSDDAGTSPGAADYPPYPEVGHWESGVTRGPANQIAVTKWSDTVGSKIIRGKANPLK